LFCIATQHSSLLCLLLVWPSKYQMMPCRSRANPKGLTLQVRNTFLLPSEEFYKLCRNNNNKLQQRIWEIAINASRWGKVPR
jgi:hypothetical protein